MAPPSCDCGITDSFNRTVASGWGTSDIGLPWAIVNPDSAVYDVTPGFAEVLYTLSFASASSADLVLPTQSFSFVVRISGYAATGHIGYFNLTSPGSAASNYVYLNPASSHVEVDDATVDGALAFAFTGADLMLRVQRDATGTKARLWYAGASEPGSWGWSAAAGSRSGTPAVSFEPEGPMSVPVRLSELSVTDLSAMPVLLNRCTAVQFDDFNRTVAPGGWGTATPSGFLWSTFDPVEVVHSVDGAAGVVAITTSGSSTGFISAPAGASAALLLDTFTMRTVFKFSAVPDASHPTYPHPDMMISVQPTSAAYGGHFDLGSAEVTVNSSHANPYSSLGNLLARVDVNPAFWVPGNWYTLEAVVVSGTLTTNLYAPGNTVPDYTVGGGTIPAGRNGSLQVVTSKAGWPDLITIDFDSIDFDYAGRPCYYDCSGAGCGITDSFTRTVSGGWGTSDAGFAWVDNGTYGGSVASVDGSVGVMTVLGGGGLDRKMSGFATGLDYQFSVRFQYSLYANATNSIDFVISPTSTLGFNRAAMDYSGAGVWVEWWDGNALVPMTFTQGVWYTLRAQRIAGVVSVKVWADGGAEPAWMASGTQTTYLAPMNFFEITANSGTSLAFTALVDSLDITGVDRCTAVQFDDFTRTVASGWGTATPSGHVWTILSADLLAIDYTVSVDGSKGIITQTGSASVLEADIPYPFPASDQTFLFTGLSMNWTSDPLLWTGDVQMQIKVSTGLSADYMVGFETISNYDLSDPRFLDWWYVDGNGSSFDLGATPVTFRSPFSLRVECSPTVFRARMWADGTAEPGTWDFTAATPDAAWAGNALRIRVENRTSFATAYTVDSIDLDYAARPCYYDCSGSGCGITDTFTRTVASGWGTSDAGYVWDDDHTADSVDGSRGVMTLAPGVTTNNVFANLYPAACTGGVVTAQVVLDAAAPASDRGVSLGGDGGRFADGVFMSLTTDRTFSLFTYTLGSSIAVAVDPTLPFSMRFLISGGTVYGRVWQASASEPATWDLSYAIGVAVLSDDVYLNAFCGAPFTKALTVGWDDLDLAGVDRCTAVQFDDFNRTVASGWGTATPGGYVWTSSDATTGAVLSVGGASGVAYVPHSGSFGGSIRAKTNADPAAPWNSDTWTMTARIKIADSSSDTANADLWMSIAPVGTDVAWEALRWRYRSHGGVFGSYLENVDETLYAAAPMTNNTFYWFKWSATWSTGAFRAKMWADGTAEPGWMIDGISSPSTVDPSTACLDVVLTSRNLSDDTFTFDSIDFDYAGRIPGCAPIGPSAVVPPPAPPAPVSGGDTTYIDDPTAGDPSVEGAFLIGSGNSS